MGRDLAVKSKLCEHKKKLLHAEVRHVELKGRCKQVTIKSQNILFSDDNLLTA